MMKDYLFLEQGIKLLYAISAVIGIIGCAKVYYHFITDSDETRRVALKWFGMRFPVIYCCFLFIGNL